MNKRDWQKNPKNRLVKVGVKLISDNNIAKVMLFFNSHSRFCFHPFNLLGAALPAPSS